MSVFFSASRWIPVGVSTALVMLCAGFVLRLATPEFTGASRRATMGALDGAARRATNPPRASAALFTDSAEKNSRKGNVLRRISAAAPSTYLASMLPQVDSAIRRWPDDRAGRPLRVALVNAAAIPGFRDDFARAVAWSVARWNGAVLPVQLDFRGMDTARADIVVSWSSRLDSGRTGKADVTWDQRQHIRRAAITLATHAPDGRGLTSSEMTALALHELGHALGLAHSAEAKDALFPMTRAADLTERDRATARLLYDLPPGNLRN